MKLASVERGGKALVGIVEANYIAIPEPNHHRASVRDLLTMPPEEREELRIGAERIPIEDAKLLPPIVDPDHIIGIGLNTRSHFQETLEVMSRTPGDFPKYPRLFTRSINSHVGHKEPILIPKVSPCLDYEGEIAIVVGRGGRYIPKSDALHHIGGYACYNDGSIRDFQRHSTQVTAGKNFVASGSFGPWITTADEVPDPTRLTLETRVNGERRQTMTMEDLIFSFADLIAYSSQVFDLRPGDLILTGSPAGIGALDKNWLRAGDLVEVTIPAVGTLSNPVKAE